MTNELELRLECMKLAVAITPALNIPIRNKIVDNFNFILDNVTDNGSITFDSLNEKKVEGAISNLVGFISIAEEFIKGFKTEDEEELPIPEKELKNEEVKTSKKKAPQPKTEPKEETV